jgi:hypothetical protein
VNVGDRVRIERDETCYPSKGTWPQFRGLIGTMVEINADKKRPQLTEYGVVFGRQLDMSRKTWNGGEVTWFKAYEMIPLAPVRHAATRSPAPAIDRVEVGP